ncbi:hypothetical protein DFH09DRAFT_1372596, partial [Mycena vulgaris]
MYNISRKETGWRWSSGASDAGARLRALGVLFTATHSARSTRHAPRTEPCRRTQTPGKGKHTTSSSPAPSPRLPLRQTQMLLQLRRNWKENRHGESLHCFPVYSALTPS